MSEITISKKEYRKLLKDSTLLNLLENAGVDNWEGWDYARFDCGENYSDLCEQIDIDYKD
jgi:hypothetical protein